MMKFRVSTFAVAGTVFLMLFGFPVSAEERPLSPPKPGFQAGWLLENDSHAGQFGFSLGAGDVNGDGFDDVLVGARVYPKPHWRGGRALLYYGSKDGPHPSPAWTMAGTEPEERFAETVACADVNGDGFDDVLVGSWMRRNRRGAVWLFFGSKDGPSAQADWFREGEWEGLCFGFAVGAAGDVNGDGFADVLVGATYDSQGERRPGRIYAFYGGPGGLKREADWVYEGRQRSARLGVAVATAGDVNGDGLADILVGESGFTIRDRKTQHLISTGRVMLFHGDRRGLSHQPACVVYSPEALSSNFGKAISSAGDVNGDGFSDVLIGASHAKVDSVEMGKTYLHLGSALGLNKEPAWIARGTVPGGLFGCSVSGAGDVDQDGFADVIIGANRFTGPGTNFVRAWLFRGAAQGLQTNAAWLVEVDQSFADQGITVRTAGDMNGDGYPDVCVASFFHKNPQQFEGHVQVFPGGATGLPGSMLRPETPHLAVAWHPQPAIRPWWRHPWLLTGASLTFLLAVGLGTVRALELRSLRRRMRALENEQAVANERARIARDMHDQLGASLTRLSWLSELAKRDLVAPDRAQAHVEELAVGTRALAATVDEIVWALNPHKDKIENLASYLASYAEQFLRPIGLRCRLDFPEVLPPLRLPSEARHSLFLAVQEALNNTAKHASASQVRLGLRVTTTTLCLWIEDDGRGFDPESATCRRSGLGNLRHRLEALGGRVTVASQSGHGTRVEFEVPLSQ